MRRVVSLGLALVGAVLAVPAASMAGQPEVCSTCHGLSKSQARAAARQHAHRAPHLCPNCLAKAQAEAAARGESMPIAMTPPTQVVATAPGAPCTACQAGATIVAGPVSEAPGFASVGGPAPGYASLGGTVLSAEPTPIGVVRTGYQPGPEMASPARSAGQVPSQAATAPTGVSTMTSPPHRRGYILPHLFGVSSLGHLGEGREARRLSQHAAIPYGPTNGMVTEVPASVVYGR